MGQIIYYGPSIPTKSMHPESLNDLMDRNAFYGSE